METISKIVLLQILLSATTVCCFGQKQTNDCLKAVVTAIANSNVYEVSYTVGFAGTVSKQYLRFKQLLSIATDQQLRDLATQNKNAVVRLYALQALKQKHANIADCLLKQFQHDKTIIITLDGCNGDKRTVSELAEQNLKYGYNLTNN